MSKFKYVALALMVITAVGCRRDMQTQPKFPPLWPSRFYPDGRSARPIPPGTIAIDEVNINPALDTGSVNGQFVTTIPIPVTLNVLKRGQVQFNIYCAPCHGRTGFGYGMIASRGFAAPANLNGERIRNAPPGYIYQVIVNGYGAMAGYNYQIKSTNDRWAVVAYIRALELSRQTNVNDILPQERAQLESQR